VDLLRMSSIVTLVGGFTQNVLHCEVQEGGCVDLLRMSSIVTLVGGAKGLRGSVYAGAPMMYSIHHTRSSPKEMGEYIDSSHSGMSAKMQ
jgi:hypothetical protein